MKSFALVLSSLAVASAHGGKGAGKKKGGRPVLPIAQTPVDLSCPAEFELQGMSCVRECIESLVAFCPDGELRGDECVNFAYPDLMCPAGTIRRGNQCASTVTRDFEFMCPPGFDMAGGLHYAECSREIAQPPRLVCPPGSEPYGEDCVSYRIVDELVSCPAGTEWVDGACLSTRTYECQIEGKHDKKGGHKRNLKSKSAGKGKGGKKDKWNDYVAVPVVEVVSQECEETVAHPPVVECPAGSEMYGGACRVAEFCSRVEHFVPSIIDAVPASRICPAGFNECGGKKDKKSNLECCRTEEIPAEPYCLPGWLEVGDECMEVLPIDYRCPEGFTRRGGECVSQEIVPPVGVYTITYQCEGASCGIERAGKKGGKGGKKGGH